MIGIAVAASANKKEGYRKAIVQVIEEQGQKQQVSLLYTLEAELWLKKKIEESRIAISGEAKMHA